MFWTTVKLALLTLSVAWLATARGQLELIWGEWQLTARPGAMLVVLLLSLLLLLWGGRSLRELWFLPRHVGLWRRTRRRDAGYRALLQALSEGGASTEADTAEGTQARLKKALEARRLLDKDSLSTLIAAQVAEASSDFEQARTLYENLQRSPETRFVALLSLARLARHEGAYERAQSCAHEAEALRPSSLLLWIEQIEIARQGDSPEAALFLLDKIRRRGTTLPPTFQTLEAGLRIEAMRKALEAGNTKEAVRQAHLAYLSSPQRGIVALRATTRRRREGGEGAGTENRPRALERVRRACARRSVLPSARCDQAYRACAASREPVRQATFLEGSTPFVRIAVGRKGLGARNATARRLGDRDGRKRPSRCASG